MADTFKRVRAVLVAELGVDPDTVTLDASLSEDLGADTLDCVIFLIECEREFGIDIPEEDAEPLKRVRDVVGYVTARLTAQRLAGV